MNKVEFTKTVSDFVEAVRAAAPSQAVGFRLEIGTNEHEWGFSCRTPENMKREGVSMKNLAGEWIKESAE